MKRIESVAVRVTLFLVLALLPFSGPALAACPTGSVFKTFNRINETTRAIQQNMAFSRGKVEAETGGKRNINARVPSLPVQGKFRTKVTWPVINHVWELSIPFASRITIKDLMVVYSVSGGNGRSGFFQSADIPSSVMKVTVIPKGIKQSIVNDRIVFRGYINLNVDYSAVTVAGSYNGMISAAVECR
ncbi:MAG: hypothetical protein OEZ04_09840 [Nitrospinota bacterium]|nr:hypothetical protein [Nitrospinota bacterium]